MIQMSAKKERTDACIGFAIPRCISLGVALGRVAFLHANVEDVAHELRLLVGKRTAADIVLPK